MASTGADDDFEEVSRLFSALPESDKRRTLNMLRAVADGDDWARGVLMSGRERGLDLLAVVAEFERYQPAPARH